MKIPPRRRSILWAIPILAIFSLIWFKGTPKRQHWVIKPLPKEEYHLAFSPDGSTLACGGQDGTVTFWQANVDWWRSRRRWRTIHVGQKAIIRLSFSRDGKWLATADEDEQVKIWDAKQGTLRCSIAGRKLDDRDINGLAWFPDNRTLAIAFEMKNGPIDFSSSAAYGRLELWDTQLNRRRKVIVNRLHGSVTVSPNGKFYVLENYSNPTNVGELRRLSDGKLVHLLPGVGINYDQMGDHYSLNFSPDSCRLAATSSWNESRLFDVITGRLLHKFDTHRHKDLVATFSVDSQWLAVGGGSPYGLSSDYSLEIFPVKTMVPRELVPSSYSETSVVDVAFSPDGKYLATSRRSGGVEMWKTTK